MIEVRKTSDVSMFNARKPTKGIVANLRRAKDIHQPSKVSGIGWLVVRLAACLPVRWIGTRSCRSGRERRSRDLVTRREPHYTTVRSALVHASQRAVVALIQQLTRAIVQEFSIHVQQYSQTSPLGHGCATLVP